MEKKRCLACMAEYEADADYCPSCGAAKDFVQAEPHFLAAGELLEGRYLVGKAISSGKFNITYLAFDREQKRKVVLKEYFPTDLASRMLGQKEISTYDGEKAKRYESGLVAFIEEAEHLKQLSESMEGVARVLDVFIENSTAYSVVEYVEGIPLSEVLKSGALPWNDLVQVMNPLLSSMEVIHAAGIVHYNISPDNIMMTRDKSVKLLSFGGSKLATNLGSIIHKGYSPIELYKENVSADPAIDVYSIAAVMYYAITGTVPPDAVERSHKDALRSPLAMGIQIPVNVNNAIMNALNVNRQYRTPSCTQLLGELNSAGDVKRITEVKKKEETGKISKKAKVLIIIAAVVAVLAIAGIIISAVRSKTNNENTKDFDSQQSVYYIGKDLEDKEVKADIEGLEKHGVKVEYTYVINANAEKDAGMKITSQTTEPKDAETAGDLKAIHFTVTRPPIEMPDLEGVNKKKAIKKLTELGLDADNITIHKKKTNDYDEGDVVYQSIDPGEKIEDLDVEITLTVAKNFTTTTKSAPTTRRSAQNYTKPYSGGNSGAVSKQQPAETTTKEAKDNGYTPPV